MTRVCPSCKTAGPAQLTPGQLCAACAAQVAWSQYGEAGKLVIDRESIAAAMRRRQGENAEPVGRRLLAVVAPVVTLGLGALAVWLLRRALSARPIGPLDALLDDIASSVRWALLAGFAALAAGIVALVRMRRRRHFRKLPVLASHLLAIVAGCSAFFIAGVHWLALGPGAGSHTSMPPRAPLGVPAHVERILDATVVVLAPGADGDARELAMGTGAVVARDATRAWIVTCSHVAMPYSAVGAWRHAREAWPVWVQLADGREGEAHVRWAAPPPLDVALVELAIDHAPDPVVIAADTTELQPAAPVTFVPNPYRAGWKVLHGQLVRRETHRTTAGSYDLLYTDLPVIFGDSGSGLYDAQGRLVGLNTWTRLDDGMAQGISLPSETMRVLVDTIGSGKLDNLDDAVLPPQRANSMDNVRLRRLKADHEAMRRLAHRHPRIEIEGVFGNPPDRYRLVLRVKSLRERGEAIETATEHRLEVSMPRGYPRDAPLFRMLTPVFHPNIAPHAVCIGDDWTASEPIDQLIQRVGEILAYQSYNTKSPLNGRAAQWVDENRDRLPIDPDEFFVDLAAAPPPSSELAMPACSNCAARDVALTSCGAGHSLCADCEVRCQTCARLLCLCCGGATCQACEAAPACDAVDAAP